MIFLLFPSGMGRCTTSFPSRRQPSRRQFSSISHNHNNENSDFDWRHGASNKNIATKSKLIDLCPRTSNTCRPRRLPALELACGSERYITWLINSSPSFCLAAIMDPRVKTVRTSHACVLRLFERAEVFTLQPNWYSDTPLGLELSWESFTV